ncbi:hypothetical protein P4U99_26285 [Brevibacillus agri]|uniref:hypothetical protein n=1 Tax=Paenibacillaceae TaxID=186822 RepID=UPI00047D4B3E|nr:MULTISPECIES: hypothetical protein [Brevibacillus]MED1646628.1 hypothetical protein [Brevibacillus agri]MED1657386.1 hypothetical protein [Brevibacillus agri]MED1688158.1 hypothetical protein [Brevibacillus agri]MED1695413.1 hypothetical protein [Brevibacillus agri]MED1699065.1 hypothetical protein [Brevibacillus agri]
MDVRLFHVTLAFVFFLLQLFSPESVQADAISVQSNPMINGTIEGESHMSPETKKNQVSSEKPNLSPYLLAFFVAFLVLLPVIKLIFTIIKHLTKKNE